MIVLLIGTLEFTNSKTNDNANGRGGLNQMPNVSVATQTWPYRALQVDFFGGRAYVCIRMCLYVYMYL